MSDKTGYIRIAIRPDVYTEIEEMEEIYREDHPEMDQIPLSKNKIIHEMYVYCKLKMRR